MKPKQSNKKYALIQRPASPFRSGIAGSSDLLTYCAQLERYVDQLERQLDAERAALPLLKQETAS